MDYAQADRTELEELIRPTGFYRNKANSLIRLGQELVERFDGEVPDTMDELVTLPGVGRKTANVILGNAFDIPGITVDTHFGRLVRRWRWTAEEDPVKVEHAVGELIERSEWTLLSHRVIFHGRRVCHARKPACGVCVLAKDCPSFGHRPHRSADRRAAGEGTRDRAPAGAGRAVAASRRTMSTSTRWTIAVLVVVVGGGRRRCGRAARRTTAIRAGRAGESGSATAERVAPRRRHRRSVWPRPARARRSAAVSASGPESGARGSCAGCIVECAADGAEVDVAQAAGRPGRGAQSVGLLVCAVRARNCPRWPSTSAGPGPT